MATLMQSFRRRLARLIDPTKNTISLPQQFLRYGSKKGMTPSWDEVIISDPDLYKGYSYAAIRNRANTTARIAMENVRTEAKDDQLIHPYLEILTESPTFSDYYFWYAISTFLDLEGVFYLYALRNFDGMRYGDIQEFKLLNPYYIRRMLSPDKLTVVGYTEFRAGMKREIPIQQIIEMRELNPFSENDPYAMTDAAKPAQFTLMSAGDFTRQTLKNNINAPGILSTDVIMTQEQFENFTSRVKEHTKGEPLFGNGAGALEWKDMTVNLKNAELGTVNEVSRDELFTVLGQSKTNMGIEQSGTTRDTAKVQKDLFVENQVLPRIQLIIDALNQDYKNNYMADYKRTEAVIKIDNPNATDQDAEMKETDVTEKQYDIYKKLVNDGYDPKLAASYVAGEITLEKLGSPTNEPKVQSPDGIINFKQFRKMVEDVIDKKNNIVNVNIDQKEKKIESEENQFEKEKTGVISQQQGALQNAITNIDTELIADAITRIRDKMSKNAASANAGPFATEGDLITQTSKKQYVNDLKAVLEAFENVVMSFEGGKQMRDRVGEYSKPGIFGFDSGIKKYIKSISKKAAESHIDTISSRLFEQVRDAAREGKGVDVLINDIKNKYAKDIVETRAKAIARTETNRAFTRAQYEADIQFIRQNKLQGKAYKKWVTRSDNPCPFCQSLANEPAVPFQKSFRDIGDTLHVDGQELEIGFEDLYAGNAHTNCSCSYELIFRD